MAEKTSLSRAAKVVLAIVALGAITVPCLGVSLAIALPAFINYTRRARTAEVRPNLTTIRTGIDLLGGPPPDLAPTPDLATAGPEPRRWPSSAAHGWARIGFTPLDPLRYSYSVTNDPRMGTVRIEAAGDLDGDGVRSSLSQTGRLDPATGAIVWGELVVLDELE